MIAEFDRIIIEVGANSGSDTIEYARSDDTFVFAFEPSPLLYPGLVEKFKYHRNVLILPMAIDLENGFAEFNVSDAGDMGVGSLYDYHPDMATNQVGQHPVFKAGFIGKHNVMKMRLDTFLGNWGITHVDFLHIDAQGSDFRVIQSLGDKLNCVQEGQCECTYKVPLYSHSSVVNYYDDCMKYLDLHGFNARIDYIHANETEVDIQFIKRN